MLDAGLFTQPFMMHAWISGTIVAVLSAFVGFFVVVRSTSFAAHALPEAGFAGGAGAVLLGVNPVYGLAAFAVGGALFIGYLEKRGRSDAVTALILTAALGTGALFLSLSNNYASGAYTLLFGQIVGVDSGQLVSTAVGAVLCLSGIVFLYRPLLLSTVSGDVAQARGVSVRLIEIAFLVLVGIAASVMVPVVGALLCFSLLICPTAASIYLSATPTKVMGLSLVFSLLIVWQSIFFAYVTGLPIGFFVAMMGALLYGIARVISWLKHRFVSAKTPLSSTDT
jgi:zinc/manganese transport system permease protein